MGAKTTLFFSYFFALFFFTLSFLFFSFLFFSFLPFLCFLLCSSLLPFFPFSSCFFFLPFPSSLLFTLLFVSVLLPSLYRHFPVRIAIRPLWVYLSFVMDDLESSEGTIQESTIVVKTKVDPKGY